MVSLVSAIIIQHNLHHYQSREPSSIINLSRTSLQIALLNASPVTLSFLSLLPSYAPANIFIFDMIQLSSMAVDPPQRSSTISRDMANNSLSFSNASPRIRPRHGSGSQSYGLGSLINCDIFYNCCSCQNLVNATLCKKVCGICGHGKCSSCGAQYTS